MSKQLTETQTPQTEGSWATTTEVAGGDGLVRKSAAQLESIKTRIDNTANGTRPLITYDPKGAPSVIDYTLPESISYDGLHIVEFDVPATVFNPPPIPPLSVDEVRLLTEARIAKVMADGFDDPRIFPDLGVPAHTIVYARTVVVDGQTIEYNGCYFPQYGPAESEKWMTSELRHLTPKIVLTALQSGGNLAIIRLTDHRYQYRFVDVDPDSDLRYRQRIALVESYRLTSFLGSYGAGRVVNTFSLLPGEKARLVVKTYKRTSETTKESSTILDSLNDSSSADFEDTLQKQSTETTIQTGDENVTERDLRNINVGHSLNFVFRQLNQEYYTLLHLVDIRIGYTDGVTTKVVPLHALDQFLREFIKDEAGADGKPLPEEQQYRRKLHDIILDDLRVVFDYASKTHDVLEAVERKDAGKNLLGSYFRFNKKLKTSYKDPLLSNPLAVDGVITAVTQNVIRTDGIITEALLGQATALDPYSQALQKETVEDLRRKNDFLELEVRREEAVQAAVSSGDQKKVAMLKLLYPPPPPPVPVSAPTREREVRS